MAEAATKVPKKTTPRYRYNPPKRPFAFTPRMLVRPLAALLVAGLLWGWGYPRVQDLLEQEQSSRAVQKGRVLLRGAQLVVTEQLTSGKSWEEAQQYLCTATGWQAAAAASPFGVQPLEITRLELDQRGLITAMDCQLENENRRYRVEMDIPGDRYTPQLLGLLEPTEE